MAGRRWAQWSDDASEEGARARPRPSERAGAGQQPKAAKPKGQQPHPEAMRRAQQHMERPKAPWHPLPLAELAILLGIIAAIIAALVPTGRGIIAGFLLILLGTAEFSWREHKAGFRSHGAVLASTAAFAVGVLCWEAIGLHRNVCLAAGAVTFFLAWGLLDRAYVPASARPPAETPETPAT